MHSRKYNRTAQKQIKAAVSRYALSTFEQLQLLMPFAPFFSHRWTLIFSSSSEQISLTSVDVTVWPQRVLTPQAFTHMG